MIGSDERLNRSGDLSQCLSDYRRIIARHLLEPPVPTGMRGLFRFRGVDLCDEELKKGVGTMERELVLEKTESDDGEEGVRSRLVGQGNLEPDSDDYGYEYGTD